MKNKWYGIRIMICLCAALGWWGLIYPELALTPDTVVLRLSDNGEVIREPQQEWNFDSTLYRDLLNAGPERISCRSKIYTDISSFLEAICNGDK